MSIKTGVDTNFTLLQQVSYKLSTQVTLVHSGLRVRPARRPEECVRVQCRPSGMYRYRRRSPFQTPRKRQLPGATNIINTKIASASST